MRWGAYCRFISSSAEIPFQVALLLLLQSPISEDPGPFNSELSGGYVVRIKSDHTNMITQKSRRWGIERQYRITEWRSVSGRWWSLKHFKIYTSLLTQLAESCLHIGDHHWIRKQWRRVHLVLPFLQGIRVLSPPLRISISYGFHFIARLCSSPRCGGDSRKEAKTTDIFTLLLQRYYYLSLDYLMYGTAEVTLHLYQRRRERSHSITSGSGLSLPIQSYLSLQPVLHAIPEKVDFYPFHQCHRINIWHKFRPRGRNKVK